MAYELSAVLGKWELVQPLAEEHGVPAVELRQSFGLIPLTPQVVAALVGPDAPTGAAARMALLPDVFTEWSRRGPVIYATAEMHAGYGSQTASIWRDGRLVFSQEGLPCSGPISMALLRLGVTGGRLGWDEFDVLGLGRHRRTDRWA